MTRQFCALARDAECAERYRNRKIVPILKKEAGFVDEIVLVSDADSNRVLALSFWKTREDAERYQREQYNSVRETLQPLLEGEPVVRTFEVHTSTGHSQRVD